LYILSEARYFLVFSALFSPQSHFMPNIFSMYQLWCYVLLDGVLTPLSIATHSAFPTVNSAFEGARRFVESQIQQILSGG
jgi:hypothetical protein